MPSLGGQSDVALPNTPNYLVYAPHCPQGPPCTTEFRVLVFIPTVLPVHRVRLATLAAFDDGSHRPKRNTQRRPI